MELPRLYIQTRRKQFVGKEFAELLKEKDIKLSVSENGFKENLLIERFWRTYKYEFVYLWDRMELKKEKTKEWVEYRGSQRQHQALEYKTPDEVYYGQRSAVA